MKQLIVAIALALAACAPSAADDPQAQQWRAIAVRAAPVTFPTPEVGRLRFRGGLELVSEDEMFGGLSGLEVLEDGRVIAVSDNGDWLEARLVLDEAEALIGFADVRMAFMRDERARPFEEKRFGDAEGLTQLPDGRFAVSFEQTQSIRIYDLNRDGPFGAAQPGPQLDEVRRLPDNAGLEALTVTEAGALLVGAEGGGRATPLWLAPLAATAPVAPFAGYQLSDGYSLTSFDRLPDGGFVALERFYAPIIGARARIARFAQTDLEGGAMVTPERLAELSSPMPVDNFEGIAAVRLRSGALRLYIVSDDNFSARQRTLLLAFDVAERTS